MPYFCGTIAHGSTGTKTISVGFQPVALKITVAQRYQANQGFTHMSMGSSNGVKQHCDSIFQDTSGGLTLSSDMKLISHYERVGETITEVLAGTVHSFTTGQVKYNITTANANYNLFIEIWG